MIKIGLVGFGKIAFDQHVPALLASADFDLVAITQGIRQPPPGVRSFETIEELVTIGAPDAITLCTPPQGRHRLAMYAIERGLPVMLEKPPAQSVAEVDELIAAARRKSVALFGTWHSREAPAVEPARRWLEHADIREVQIHWREDVRHWHPGQAWIWDSGGMGVFDAGINGLSIATRILPRPLELTSALLSIPDNRCMPIAASLKFTDGTQARITAELDWRECREQTWSITVTATKGILQLHHGGAALSIDGATVALEPEAEYPALYRRFATLIAARASDVDLVPLRLVCAALDTGQRESVAAFLE